MKWRVNQHTMCLVNRFEQMMNTLPAQVERHVCSLHARELQYIVHQFQQQFGIGVDDACIPLLLRSGQLRIVHQQIGKTRYGIERRTYLTRSLPPISRDEDRVLVQVAVRKNRTLPQSLP